MAAAMARAVPAVNSPSRSAQISAVGMGRRARSASVKVSASESPASTLRTAFEV